MSDAFWIFGAIAAFGLLNAWIAWCTIPAPKWVIKVRRWLNRGKK